MESTCFLASYPEIILNFLIIYFYKSYYLPTKNAFESAQENGSDAWANTEQESGARNSVKLKKFSL